MDNKKYLEKLTRKTRKKYDKIKKIKCPCIGSDVVFNAKGFNHLLREVTGRDRTIKEKIYKLKLFPLAIPTIKNCKTINEIRQEKNATVDREKKKKDATYWSLIHNVGKKRDTKVKIILRKIGDGKIIFWSIMKK